MEAEQEYNPYDGNALRQPQAAPSLPEEELSFSEASPQIVRDKLGISPFAVLGCLAITVLMALFISSLLRLYAVRSTQAQLQAEVAALEETHTQLQSSYDSNYDLERIETYAQTQLGMHQAQGTEIVYLNLGGTDEAVVLASTPSQEASLVLSTFRESFSYLLGALKSFFHKA